MVSKRDVVIKVLNLKEVIRTVYISQSKGTTSFDESFFQKGLLVLDVVIENVGSSALTYEINNQPSQSLQAGVAKCFESILIFRLKVTSGTGKDFTLEYAGIETNLLGF